MDRTSPAPPEPGTSMRLVGPAVHSGSGMRHTARSAAVEPIARTLVASATMKG